MNDHADTADPVGATEIAARLGIGRPTVERWQERHAEFPKRRWTVGGRPAWDWQADILPWLQKTNRPTGAPMDTMWTLDTDATPGTLQAIAADVPEVTMQPSPYQGGFFGTTVSGFGTSTAAPSDLAALAKDLRKSGYTVQLRRGN